VQRSATSMFVAEGISTTSRESPSASGWVLERNEPRGRGATTEITQIAKSIRVSLRATLPYQPVLMNSAHGARCQLAQASRGVRRAPCANAVVTTRPSIEDAAAPAESVDLSRRRSRPSGL